MVKKLKPITAVLLLTGFLLISRAHAWNNDYSSSQTHDSYSQSWNSYKQQNNINTQPAYQQSWWSSAMNSVGNFFSSVGNYVSKAITNIGNFCTNIYNNVHDFFIKTPEIKANLATAPPTKERNASSTKTINTDLNKSLATKNNISDTYKAQTNQKNNPYAYLKADKACYDSRASGLSQFSPRYQAIEAEYAARDKWAAAQDAQPEGKLADVKPAENLDSIKPPQVINQQQQLNPKDIAVIAPEVVTNPDPSIMPGQRWETVKATLPVSDAPKQTTWQGEAKSTLTDAAKFYGDKAKVMGNDFKQFGNDVRTNWNGADSKTEAGVKGFLEGFGREVKSEDLYTPVQKFFQNKSDQITNVTLAAMKGLDIAGTNVGNEKGFFPVASRISIGTMKGCVVAGAVVAQTVVDVGKFGSEIPKIMANTVLAKDAFMSGDLKQAWRYFGNALGGVGREVTRATVVGSLFKAADNAFIQSITGKIISSQGAEKILTNAGFKPGMARDFVASFDGPINTRLVKSGETFLRYTDEPSSQGSFLSKYIFDNSKNSVASLNLAPYNNQARYVQVVTAVKDSVVLEGRISSSSVRQTLITNRQAFKFDIGEALNYE